MSFGVAIAAIVLGAVVLTSQGGSGRSSFGLFTALLYGGLLSMTVIPIVWGIRQSSERRRYASTKAPS